MLGGRDNLLGSKNSFRVFVTAGFRAFGTASFHVSGTAGFRVSGTAGFRAFGIAGFTCLYRWFSREKNVEKKTRFTFKWVRNSLLEKGPFLGRSKGPLGRKSKKGLSYCLSTDP